MNAGHLGRDQFTSQINLVEYWGRLRNLRFGVRRKRKEFFP